MGFKCKFRKAWWIFTWILYVIFLAEIVADLIAPKISFSYNPYIPVAAIFGLVFTTTLVELLTSKKCKWRTAAVPVDPGYFSPPPNRDVPLTVARYGRPPGPASQAASYSRRQVQLLNNEAVEDQNQQSPSEPEGIAQRRPKESEDIAQRRPKEPERASRDYYTDYTTWRPEGPYRARDNYYAGNYWRSHADSAWRRPWELDG
jgi:hypothetical protein